MDMRKKKDVFYANAEEPKTEAAKPEQAPEVDVNKIKSEYLDVVFYQIKQRDGLLGDFSADGKYSISDENTLKALLTLPKLLQDMNQENIYASLKVGKYVLNFRVDLEMNESYCTAALKIIELEHRGEETIKHIQELDKVVEVYSPLFLDNILERWEIVREIPVLDKDNPIITYLSESEEGEIFLRELSEILAQVYLLKMLKILETSGEKGKAVAEEYKSILEKLLSEDPGIAQDSTRLKGILDALILKHDAFDEIIAAGGADVLKGYSRPIDNIRGKGEYIPEIKIEKKKEPVTPVVVKAPEKKPAKKKPAAKKEDKKKDKGKDKPKKKDDKKKVLGLAPADKVSKVTIEKHVTQPKTEPQQKTETKESNETSEQKEVRLLKEKIKANKAEAKENQDKTVEVGNSEERSANTNFTLDEDLMDFGDTKSSIDSENVVSQENTQGRGL